MAELLHTVWFYVWIGFIILFFFGLCIFIHELGHFLVAKLLGLHVNAFSIGFKKIWGFKYGGVDYRIGCIPCGGYVDIPQLEPSDEIKTAEGKPLPRAKPIHRILTALAGPVCNILLGFGLGVFIWIYGVPQDSPRMREIKVAVVDKESPEYKAGLREGDAIYSVNGKTFYCTWNKFIQKILFTVGEVTLNVKRGDKDLAITYMPVPNEKRTPNEKISYPFFEPKIPAILYPMENSLAAKAGLKQGDIVLSVNGKKLQDWTQYVPIVRFSEGKPLSFVVSRDGKEIEIANVQTKLLSSDKGIGVYFDPKKPVLLGVIPTSPAEKAGLKDGDTVLAVNGTPVKTSEEARVLIKKSDGKEFEMKLERDGKDITKKLAIGDLKIYGIGTSLVFINHPNPWEQFVQVLDMTYKTLRGVMSKKSSLKPSNFSGPIGIFRAIGITAYRGSFSRVLNLIVIITFSLGLFNLLPVPVLDGGHISIAVIETIIGRPIPLKLLQPITVAFIIILISFMLFVSYYDVIRVHSDFSKKKQNVATYNSETTEKSDAAKSENEAKKNVDKKTPDKKD